MTSIYLLKDDKVLLLFRKDGRVVSDVWTGSAGGHFEEFELNDAKACVLREMNEELGLCEDNIRNLSLRYVTLRRTKGEIRQNYYFFAILNEEVSDDLVSNEGELKWFSLNKLDELEILEEKVYGNNESLKNKYKNNFADRNFYDAIKESENSQNACPWTFDEYDMDREELFYASLQVRKAFILNSPYIKRNLFEYWQKPGIQGE